MRNLIDVINEAKTYSDSLKNDVQKLVSDVIPKISNEIDIDGIKKMIEHHDYDIHDVIYYLEFPTMWKGKYKQAYSDMRYLLDAVSEELEKHSDKNTKEWWECFYENVYDMIK
jgi:hypothetical protein